MCGFARRRPAVRALIWESWGAMAAISGSYDHNDEDAPKWLAENLQNLYQVG